MLNSDAERRAIQALIYLASFDARRDESTGHPEVLLPEGWEREVAGKAILFDRRGDQDCLRVVSQEEAIEFGNRARAVERELGPGPGRDG